MRYHYEKPTIYSTLYGEVYECDHPVYNRCTLYRISNLGLSIIQQRYDPNTKSTWWTDIDPWMVDSIYLHPNFKEYFDSRAGVSENGIFPTVSIRQIMWALKMKPIPRERWETCFDRRVI